MNGRFIGRWILLIALAFVVASVWFTNNLARQLAAEEQKNVAIWAEATRQLIMADEATDINFVSSIIEKNTNIPVYMTDAEGNILLSRNVKKAVDDPRTLNGRIELRRAHQANDRAVMQAYGFPIGMREAECVARLLGMYQAMVQEI